MYGYCRAKGIFVAQWLFSQEKDQLFKKQRKLRLLFVVAVCALKLTVVFHAKLVET